MFRPGDIPEDQMLLVGHRLKRAMWYRPQAIAPDFELIGFTATPKGITNVNQLDANGNDVDGQRIFQGQLDDKWFLNALSMVVAEPQAFKRVNCLDPGTFRQFA